MARLKPLEIRKFSKIAQLKSLAATFARTVSEGSLIVPDEVWQQRIDVCFDCAYHVETPDSLKCNVCGCNLQVKAKITGSACPIGRWGAQKS